MRTWATRRQFGAVCVLLVLTVCLALVSATSAFAWQNVNTVTYGFFATNNTGQPVNDANVRCTATNGTTMQAPTFMGGWSSPWSVSNIAGPITIGGMPWRVVTFGYPTPGPSIAVNGAAPFVVKFKTTLAPPVRTAAFLRWTVDGNRIGPLKWLGVRWGSDPALYNPATDSEGIANTHDMVVTNLQFAMSPSAIGNEELSLDNPTVQGLFSASADSLRPGPFVVSPGGSYDLILDSSITEPTMNGTTVIAKGMVEDAIGDTTPFLIQFAWEPEPPTPVPASGLLTIALLGVVGIVFAVGSMLRRTRPTSA